MTGKDGSNRQGDLPTEGHDTAVLLWKRIEDAPKDGSLIYTHDGAYPVIAAWCEWPKYTTRRVGPWWNRKIEKVADGVTEGWYSVLFPFGEPTAQDRVRPHIWRPAPLLPWEELAATADAKQAGTDERSEEVNQNTQVIP